jgi:small subunit ribosomal protein S27e
MKKCIIIMKKHNIMIPKPRSNFVKIECDNCQNTMILYTYSTKIIKCQSCDADLAVNTGGQAKISGKIIETMD